MELSPKQQIVEAIKGSKNILLLTHRNPDGDAVGSLIALFLTLTKLGPEGAPSGGKNVTLVCPDSVPTVFSYLPIDKISTELKGKRDFIISLDLSQTKAEKFLYKIEDGKINFTVTPKSGEFSPEMVSYPGGKFKSDLIIVLDSPDLDRLGKPYEDNSDLFFETPVVNIDHHAGNDHFGKINLVDLTATSTCEILVSIFEALSGDTSLMTSDVATALLTGIITDTDSFQNANTTPKSLTVAAQLVAAEADREEIIRRIYKTRTLPTLRLWGKVLTNIHDETNYRFVWSELKTADFLAVGATADDANGVVDELLKTASGVDFVLLLAEKEDGIHGSLRSVAKGIDVAEIAKLFAGGGHALAAGFVVDASDPAMTVEKIIAHIRDHQK